MKSAALKNGGKIVLLIAMIAAVSLFASFAGRASAQQAASDTPAGGGCTIEVIDASGAKFEFGTVESVISTTPAITEIICYVGAADRLKGVTTLCDYPEEVKKIAKIGDVNLNYEKVLQIKPDVVFIMNGLRAREKEVLESFGIKAFALDLNSFGSIFESVDRVAKILRKDKNSAELFRQLNLLKVEIKKRQKQPIRSVYFETWGEPPMSVGNKSFINDLMKHAFAINIFSNVEAENIPVSLEKIIDRNPQYIIMAYPGKTSEIAIRSGFSGITAVKDGNILAVDYNLYVRPGPRMVRGVLDLYNRLYSDKKIDYDKIFKK